MFRKKPVVIEAERLDHENVERLAAWSGGRQEFLTTTPTNGSAVQIVIPTLEGNMFAREGDYIIRGVQGEFYPCKPDIFEATYEAVQ